jgi:ribonuclease P protein component
VVSGAGANVALRRLRTRAQFQALLAYRPVSRTTHFALHRLCPQSQPQAGDEAGGASLFHPTAAVWVGAMVPKRWARRAVTRNAIRRQIYAVCDELSGPLPAGAHLVRMRAAFAPRQFPSASSDALKREVRAELRQLFSQTGRGG